jgi:hypothetical protein
MNLIPLLGGIVVFVLLCLSGEAGRNKYDANPKSIAPEVRAGTPQSLGEIR